MELTFYSNSAFSEFLLYSFPPWLPPPFYVSGIDRVSLHFSIFSCSALIDAFEKVPPDIFTASECPPMLITIHTALASRSRLHGMRTAG